MPIDYQIEVDIIRFDATRGGDAVLNARWTILAGDSKEILVRKHSAVTQEAGGLGYEDLVAAESRLLETLSREMAAAIKSIAQGK
jgi:uncharacterized lipoprotein YmbA